MSNVRKTIFTVAATVAVGIAATPASATPITFGATDYDNAAVQTFGYFRDIATGSLINRGLDLGGAASAACTASTCSNPGTNTALNFTGSDTNASPLGRVTLYDTTPIDGTVKNMFSGNMSMSADILISRYNDGKGAGLVTMFNEGAGKTGLALFLQSAGNTDGYSIRLEQQTGVGDGFNVANLANSGLGSGILEDTWYRLTLDLAFTGADFTVTGKVYGHATASNPNSALGSQIGSTLIYTDTSPWTTGLSDPYEIGLVARGVSAVVDTSVTNFDFAGRPAGGDGLPLPEPGSAALFGLGLAALAMLRRKFTH